MKIYLFLLGSISSVALAGRVQMAGSIGCESTSPDAVIASYNLDLYITNHPMAGLGMTSGLFEASIRGTQGGGFDCSPVRGHVNSTSYQKPYVEYAATSNCIFTVNYILDIQMPEQDPIMHAGVQYPAFLKYQNEGPINPSPWSTIPMTCHL